MTDGWALGITLLVALTSRSPLSIITKCEEDFDEDFADIDAAQLAAAMLAGRHMRWRHSRTLSGLLLRVCATAACGRGSR